ncbi:MAG: hypothetical protein KKI08_11360 [Armatimonadetes bacterium]|nr:hypothetical protein [Armatimonadota bacterium]
MRFWPAALVLALAAIPATGGPVFVGQSLYVCNERRQHLEGGRAGLKHLRGVLAE